MSISERLKQVMKLKNLNIKAFSETTDIAYRSVQNYLREEREPNAEALLKIRHALDVNINWLLTGNGDVFVMNSDDSVLTADEMELLKKYRLATDSGKKILQATSQILCDETVCN